jgi:tetratricopeptide (TPR) repeat protein
MSKQTDKSLFIDSSFPRYYQALLSGIASYKDLGNRVIGEIKTAHAFRQTERVRELSRILLNIPIKEYKLIAEYYLVWCECQKQNYQSTALERIIEQTQTYKAQALLTRGSFDMCQGKPESALRFYSEALKSSRNVPDFLGISLATAQVKGIEGFSESALKDLEKLLPLIKHVDARLYNDFLNSYAYELGKAGRKYEARNIIKRVLVSPLAIAYPGWHETARELKEPDRSFISIPPSLPKIEPQHVEIETKQDHSISESNRPADVLPFKKLKEAPPPPKPDDILQSQLDQMTTAQKSRLLMSHPV